MLKIDKQSVILFIPSLSHLFLLLNQKILFHVMFEKDSSVETGHLNNNQFTTFLNELKRKFLLNSSLKRETKGREKCRSKGNLISRQRKYFECHEVKHLSFCSFLRSAQFNIFDELKGLKLLRSKFMEKRFSLPFLVSWIN